MVRLLIDWPGGTNIIQIVLGLVYISVYKGPYPRVRRGRPLGFTGSIAVKTRIIEYLFS